MKRIALTWAAGAITVCLAGCGDYDRNEAAYNEADAAYAEGEGNYSADGNYSAGSGGNYGGTQSASAGWPAGSRIVVEEGVTYRIDPNGVRVALGAEDSRIVVENGDRFRVDPGGARVRIDESGAEIVVDTDETTVNATTNSP